jgi:hypothetical protein
MTEREIGRERKTERVKGEKGEKTGIEKGEREKGERKGGKRSSR